ncbi:MAG: ATP-binding protein [Armatimonadetes bacterium]|nr:ATP-binding protein [Armatimonadota bacterium]
MLWNRRSGRKEGELRAGVLRTIAAFANSDGGDLIIGIADDGSVQGIDDEVAELFQDKHLDRYEALLHEHVKNSLYPHPHAGYTVSMEMRGKRTVCVVSVSAIPGVTYVVGKNDSGKKQHEVYVRTGNRTNRLVDVDCDRFVTSRLGGVWPY